MKKYVLTAVLCLFLAAPCFAKTDTFTVDGRTVKVSYAQKGDEVRAKGTVSGGGQCRQLNVDIYFDNSKQSSTAHIEAPIKNYTGKKRRAFEGRGKSYVEKKYRKGWYVSDIYLKCM